MSEKIVVALKKVAARDMAESFPGAQIPNPLKSGRAPDGAF